jgi:hypothetical protein
MKNARPRPEAASAPADSPLGIARRQERPVGVELQRKISSIVSETIPIGIRNAGADRASAGWVKPSSSPGTKPCVANAIAEF